MGGGLGPGGPLIWPGERGGERGPGGFKPPPYGGQPGEKVRGDGAGRGPRRRTWRGRGAGLSWGPKTGGGDRPKGAPWGSQKEKREGGRGPGRGKGGGGAGPERGAEGEEGATGPSKRKRKEKKKKRGEGFFPGFKIALGF